MYVNTKLTIYSQGLQLFLIMTEKNKLEVKYYKIKTYKCPKIQCYKFRGCSPLFYIINIIIGQTIKKKWIFIFSHE